MSMPLKVNDKTIHSLFIVGLVIAVVIFLMYFKVKLNVNPKGSSQSPMTPSQFLNSVAGPAGTTNQGALNGTTNGSPNLAFSTYNYKVPVPSFHYNGNEQIYMPLFGFVGYSTSGTV